jgi:hypothetical protein
VTKQGEEKATQQGDIEARVCATVVSMLSTRERQQVSSRATSLVASGVEPAQALKDAEDELRLERKLQADRVRRLGALSRLLRERGYPSA